VPISDASQRTSNRDYGRAPMKVSASDPDPVNS
jgi:hypothetical protein